MASLAEEEPNETIDEDLYSRQLYVLGAVAQRKLQRSRVIVSGDLSGIGAELCKNVVLAGVNALTLHDDGICTPHDLSASGFLTSEHDLKRASPRSECFLQELREMNANVQVQRVSGEPDLTAFDVVVLVNAPLSRILRVSAGLNTALSSQRSKLIVTGAYGLLSYCFCDFGTSWTVHDTDGEVTRSGLILNANQVVASRELEITTEAPHRLSEGDWVKFTCEGMGEDRVVQVRTVQKDGHLVDNRFRISLDAPEWASPSAVHAFEGAYFEQVKMPFEVTTHERFERSLESPRFVNNSFEDDSKPARLLGMLKALWTFLDSTKGRFPDQKEANAIIAELNLKHTLSSSDSTELTSLLRASCGNLSPICSFMGGVAGQEVLKACTGKFLPIDQWLMFAATECLPLVETPSSSASLSGLKDNRYAGQVSVFGVANQKKLGALRVLVVGAGALGCEILKNLALMGVSTQTEGGTTFVTDPDSIELSNLNRQFLFRSSTVGKNKAVCAAEAARRMNPAFQVQAFQQRVSSDAQGAFTDTFWDSLDLVINALDNVPSRLFVDSQCVYYGKPLLESGTLGTKANTLPVVPHLTESYGSDPVKDFDATGEIPACTLHAYPNLFEHVLTWARDAVFEKEFALDPTEARAFVEAARGNSMSELLTSMQKQSNTIAAKVRAARAVLVGVLPDDNGEKLFPYTFPTHGAREILLQPSAAAKNPVQVFTEVDCVSWARLKFQELFVNKIETLLSQHPADSKDGEQPFWTGKRRLPQPARFDSSDPHNVLFVVACARLMARIHGLSEQTIDAQYVRTVLSKKPPTTLEQIAPTSSSSGTTTSTQVVAAAAGVEAEWRADVARIEKVLSALPGLKVEPCKFDKDDNVHVDLVWAAAVIRARNYRIPLLDRMEAKRVVGSIIPAIATTTAAATGLVALELYKVALLSETDRRRRIEAFRAYNFNLAVNSYAGFEPRPCATKFRIGTMACNLWSVVTLKGNLTVDELIEALQRRFRGLEVSSVTTVGDVTLFNDLFGGDDDGSALQTPISDLFKRTVGRDPPEVFIPLTIDGDFEGGDDDDNDGDFVIPPIRLRWKDKPDEDGDSY